MGRVCQRALANGSEQHGLSNSGKGADLVSGLTIVKQGASVISKRRSIRGPKIK